MSGRNLGALLNKFPGPLMKGATTVLAPLGCFVCNRFRNLQKYMVLEQLL